MKGHAATVIATYAASILRHPADSSSSYWSSEEDGSGGIESSLQIESAFQWGASIAALLLLILNQLGRRSHFQASLLVIFLVTSFPTVLFNILRDEFGYWVAFLAVIAHFCFPHIIPVSRFLLFVITPDWLADELRYGIAGGVLCLVIMIVIVVTEIHGNGGFSSCRCTILCIAYWFCVFLLFLFTILYLCLGSW